MSYIGKSVGFCAIDKTLKDVRADVKAFGGKNTPRFVDSHLDRVISDAYYKFRLPKNVNPIHLNDLPLMNLDTASSSPGLPWKTYGYDSKRDVLKCPDAFQSVRRVWHMIKEGKKVELPDCSAYMRPHLVKPRENEVKSVWVYPATVSFQEACFALPLINAYKAYDSPIAYGYETALCGCAKIKDRFSRSGHQYLSLDYKSFDKAVPDWLIRVAFDFLLSNIDLTEYQDSGIPNTRKLYLAWSKIVDYFINTPIRLANGERYRKNKGVASGSYFTQLINSIVNYIITQYSIRLCQVEVLDHLVLGDDSLAAISAPLDLDQLSIIIKRFGMILNSDKSEQHSSIHDCKFLGYRINCNDPCKPEKALFVTLANPKK